MADEELPEVSEVPVAEGHTPWTPHNRRIAVLVLIGVGAALIGTLDLIAWFTGSGPHGEVPFAAAERGPGGMTPALVCLFILAFYFSRRDAWSLLVLPVLGHAALDIWQAGAAYSLTTQSFASDAIARSLAVGHAWVDGGTIVLGLALVVVALSLEKYKPKAWSPQKK